MKLLARSAVSAIAFTFACCVSLGMAAQMPSGQQATPTDHGVPVNGAPLASPPAIAETSLGGKTLTIHYNTPSMRGRKIMGALVPYGEPWRTGANPATTLITPVDLMIGTLKVPAGTYTLFTLPGATQWQFIVSKKTGEWGIPYPEGFDLGRTPMHLGKLPAPQEVMSISFEKTTKSSTELHVKWETTDVWVPITIAK
jgi:hypothetical protein